MDRSMAQPERTRSRRTFIELELDRERGALIAAGLWNLRDLGGLATGMSQAEKVARLDRAAASLRP
ncbi:MAG TPA: hypothetical protein VD836_15725 [Solirubrobacteraceae bacterium]|nr:hypothetical protein [Solirubrobacteraceae bacterium]